MISVRAGIRVLKGVLFLRVSDLLVRQEALFLQVANTVTYPFNGPCTSLLLPSVILICSFGILMRFPHCNIKA